MLSRSIRAAASRRGGGEQWTLIPVTKYRSAIHVLLNGTRDKPGVWVFDPHDEKAGVENIPIVDRREIGDLIKLIQQRLDFANQAREKKLLPPKTPSGPTHEA